MEDFTVQPYQAVPVQSHRHEVRRKPELAISENRHFHQMRLEVKAAALRKRQRVCASFISWVIAHQKNTHSHSAVGTFDCDVPDATSFRDGLRGCCALHFRWVCRQNCMEISCCAFIISSDTVHKNGDDDDDDDDFEKRPSGNRSCVLGTRAQGWWQCLLRFPYGCHWERSPIVFRQTP